MYEVRTTSEFDNWLDSLKNKTAILRISARIDRIQHGNFGDVKAISNELSELRFFFGSGYRIYYTIKEQQIILLLNGGDKSTQKKDIKKANVLLADLQGHNNDTTNTEI
jgi:putative addiction module killer protein